MLNKITNLQRVGIPVVADRFMVCSPIDAIREIPSARGIELNLRLLRRRSGQTSNFAIIPSTAAGKIQANKSKDSDLIGDSPSKPQNHPSCGRNNPKHENPNRIG